jgi:hypothetical protein
MTIRGYLRGRFLRVGLVVAVISALTAFARIWLFPLPEFGCLFLVPWIALGAASVYLKFIVECPKCLNPFGNDVIGIAFPALAVLPRNFCQACGKSVDESL